LKNGPAGPGSALLLELAVGIGDATAIDAVHIRTIVEKQATFTAGWPVVGISLDGATALWTYGRIVCRHVGAVDGGAMCLA
jgi:hypothetical protein